MARFLDDDAEKNATMEMLMEKLRGIKRSSKKYFSRAAANLALSNEAFVVQRLNTFIDDYRWFSSSSIGYQLPVTITVLQAKKHQHRGRFQQAAYRLSMMMGNPLGGTLHTLLRHGSQWRAVCPRVDQLFGELPGQVQDLIAKIEARPGRASCEQFFAHLAAAALREVEGEVGDVLNPRSLFAEMEEEIYRFIVEHISGELRQRSSTSSSGDEPTIEFKRSGLLRFPLRENFAAPENITVAAESGNKSKLAAQNWDLILVVPDARTTDLWRYAGEVHPIITVYFSNELELTRQNWRTRKVETKENVPMKKVKKETKGVKRKMDDDEDDIIFLANVPKKKVLGSKVSNQRVGSGRKTPKKEEEDEDIIWI